MIIDFGNGEGLDFEGNFRLYGTKQELLSVAKQIQEKTIKQRIEIGWVEISPNGEVNFDLEIKPWKESKVLKE